MKAEWKEFTSKKDVPQDVPILVWLPEPLFGSHIHVGVFRNTVSIIAGHFYFDVETPTHWCEVPTNSPI